MLTGRKLALTLAFTALVVVAFGMSCNGFFSDPTLNSIAIQPPSPQIEVGSTTTQTIQAWGTYSDNSRSQITSGVVWTSSDANVAVFTDNCGKGIPTCASETSGNATVEGLTSGTVTIEAAAQGLSATATATTYYGNISGFEVCLGTFMAGQSCTTSPWSPSSAKGGTQDYYVQATVNGSPVDLTTTSNFGTISPATTFGSITCTNTSSPASCTVVSGTTPTNTTYTFTVTYGTTNSVTVSIDLGP
jgi:hypothetical protein